MAPEQIQAAPWTGAPTSTRSAACSTRCSPAASRSPWTTTWPSCGRTSRTRRPRRASAPRARQGLRWRGGARDRQGSERALRQGLRARRRGRSRDRRAALAAWTAGSSDDRRGRGAGPPPVERARPLHRGARAATTGCRSSAAPWSAGTPRAPAVRGARRNPSAREPPPAPPTATAAKSTLAARGRRGLVDRCGRGRGRPRRRRRGRRDSGSGGAAPVVATKLPADLAWRPVASPPFRRQYAAATAVDGSCWVFGGIGVKSSEHDGEGVRPRDRQVEDRARACRLPLHHIVAVTYKGEPVVIGGCVPDEELTSQTSDRVYRPARRYVGGAARAQPCPRRRGRWGGRRQDRRDRRPGRRQAGSADRGLRRRALDRRGGHTDAA